MKELTESDIIRIMREEWNENISNLFEKSNLKTSAKVEDEQKEVIGQDLILRHVKSRLEYIVCAIGENDVELCQFIGGPKFTISKDELEKEYEFA